jgi:hypothetical protein
MTQVPRAEPAERLALHEKEIASLADELVELRRLHRAEIDDLRLDLAALKLFLEERHPGSGARLAALRIRANQEISPE